MLRVDIRKRRGDFRLQAAFEVAAAGVTALFGPSGCGKSTVIQCIAGLAPPDEGRIELDAQVLFDSRARTDVRVERRGIGCVFQDARLFPHLDVRSNLQYGERRSRRAAYVQFAAIVKLLELDALLDRRPAGLSGGEKQRVAIGRALLSQPRLLLLDEPLASLDMARRQEVMPYLERLRDRLAIPMVYVSHQFDEITRLATSLVLMQEGAVIRSGELGSLSQDPALHAMVGTDLVGAVLEARVLGLEASSGLMRLGLGSGELRVPPDGLEAGAHARVQLLARDVIIATAPVSGLSVRNSLAGRIAHLTPEHPGAVLAGIDIGGGQLVLARITPAARDALGLEPGLPVWALIKAGAIAGHSFAAPAPRREL